MSELDGTVQSGGEPGAQSDANGTQNDEASSNRPDSNGGQSTAEAVSRDEYEALKRRMQAADQNRSKAEAELKQLRDKDLPELEKLKRDNDEMLKEVARLKGLLNERALDTAFLKDNTHTWHNPNAALKLLDRDAIQIDDDGNVTGLKEALGRLAKEHAYLLNADTGKEEEKQKPVTPAAPPMNGTAGSNSTGASKMGTRFRALGGRVR